MRRASARQLVLLLSNVTVMIIATYRYMVMIMMMITVGICYYS